VRCTPLENEVRLGNNEVKINVRVLESKTRVFIAEGAPYWDSKFLAQLLRNQKHMQVTAAYRLSSDRWFMIDSSDGKPVETNSDLIPRTVEDLSKYDLIVLGKNIDGFLTPEMSASLRNYVSEQGGAVLFSRGKAFSSQWKDLKVLEPVNWGEGKYNSFKFIPTAEGESVGLFGQALPGITSSVWSGLPDLKDAHAVESLKPFARVLVQGDYNGRKFPVLTVRRYGLGVSSMLNADGLWKWDFYPDVKKEVNMYQEFWGQLIQWMVNYSEFLPGYSYSIHSSATEVNPDERISIRSRYRGEKDIQKLQFVITSAELEQPISLSPARLMGQDGMFAEDEGPFPEMVLVVKAEPSESDELSADPKAMIKFAENTGGTHLTTAEYREFIEDSIVPNVASVKNGLIQWKSYWLHWVTAVLLACLFGGEWWLRRRNGLL